MFIVMTWRGPLTPSGVNVTMLSAAHGTPDGVRSFDTSVAINMELLTEFRRLPRLKCPISTAKA
jgi:hypothetical protein